MNPLKSLSDRALTALTLLFFGLLGLDVVIPDFVPFIDEAVLATIASTLAATTLSRRRARRLKGAGATADTMDRRP